MTRESGRDSPGSEYSGVRRVWRRDGGKEGSTVITAVSISVKVTSLNGQTIQEFTWQTLYRGESEQEILVVSLTLCLHGGKMETALELGVPCREVIFVLEGPLSEVYTTVVHV